MKHYLKATQPANKPKDEFTVFCFFVLLLFHHTASSLSSATSKTSDDVTDLTHPGTFSYLLVYLLFFKRPIFCPTGRCLPGILFMSAVYTDLGFDF